MPVVDKRTCIGCTSCNLIDPDVFEMADFEGEEKSNVIAGQESTYDSKVQDAIHICPVDAISHQE